MISYHPLSDRQHVGQHWAKGFKTLEERGIEDIASAILKYAWSGIVWKDGTRLKANFLFSDYCVLDIDDELHEYSLEQAKQDYCDMVHVIGTTRSHRKLKNNTVCDRYRIVTPWDRRIDDRLLYEGNMQWLRKKNDAIDGSTLSGAQHFFQCIEIVSMSTEGYKQDVLNKKTKEDVTGAAEYEAYLKARRCEYGFLKRLPDWVERFLREGEKAAGKRHYKTLAVAIAMVEHGLPVEEIHDRLTKVPISREYRPGEVIGLIRYAQQTLKGKLRDGENQKGSDL